MDIKLSEKVLTDAKKQKHQKKEKQKQDFRETYDKTKEFSFPEKDGVNMEKHFYFPKIFDENGFGERMTKAAITIYPVMCARANFEHNDWFQLSQDSIAKMAGISVPTAQEGLQCLLEDSYTLTTTDKEGNVSSVPLLESKLTTEGKRHFYLYRAGFIRRDMINLWRGGYFVFFTSIIDGGVWAELSPRAKTLYLAMRCAAKQDFELYCSVEEAVPFCDQTGQDEFFKYRKWDVCITPLAELARRVNCSSNMIQRPMEQLLYYRLAERVDRWFKVYLKPRIR